MVVEKTTYQQYCRLRIECGYEGEFAMLEAVWNGCDDDAQEDMLRQLRDGAARFSDSLKRFGGDHW